MFPKGKENQPRNLGKLKLVNGNDYNAGDTEGVITSHLRQTRGKQSYFRNREGGIAERKFKRAVTEK